GRNIFGAIGRQDGDALAAGEPACRERAGNAVRHVIERAVAELARHALAAEIDDRGLVEVATTIDQIAEVGEVRHWRKIAATCSACCLPPCGGGLGWGVVRLGPHVATQSPPPPTPPHKGEGRRNSSFRRSREIGAAAAGEQLALSVEDLRLRDRELP